MIDPEMLAILANPLHPDRPALRQEGEYLICTVSGVGFPILNGIPQLLPENAIPAENVAELLKKAESNHE